MNPLYQALICFLVKLVFSIKKSRSSFDSFCLLLDPPIAASPMTSLLLWLRGTQRQQQIHGVSTSPLYNTLRHTVAPVIASLFSPEFQIGLKLSLLWLYCSDAYDSSSEPALLGFSSGYTPVNFKLKFKYECHGQTDTQTD